MTSFGYHRFPLVETCRNICMLNLKCQSQNLTPGQFRVMSREEWNRPCCISVDCVYLRETHWNHPHCSIYILSKVRGETRIWPPMTSNNPNEGSLGQNCNMRHREWPILRIYYEYIEINCMLPFVHLELRTFQHFTLALLWWGHEIDLTSGHGNRNFESSLL